MAMKAMKSAAKATKTVAMKSVTKAMKSADKGKGKDKSEITDKSKGKTSVAAATKASKKRESLIPRRCSEWECAEARQVGGSVSLQGSAVCLSWEPIVVGWLSPSGRLMLKRGMIEKESAWSSSTMELKHVMLEKESVEL